MSNRQNAREKEAHRQRENNEKDESDNMSTDTNTDDGTDTDVQDTTESLHVALCDASDAEYWVGNPTNGTAYTVRLNELQGDSDGKACSCPDSRYRQDPEEFGACKHVMAALREHPARPNMDRRFVDIAARELDYLRDAVQSLEQTATAKRADAAAESSDTGSGSNDGTGSVAAVKDDNVFAESEADKLQDAFNDAVNGMNVEAAGGKVWVNKTPNAPEYTFDAFLSGPDLMMYDPDDPSAPGDYFKNYLEADDVDQYIEEVL